MKSKKGFTLVEILTVIVILAILVVLSLPNILGLFRNAKKKTFETEVQELIKMAGENWITDTKFSGGGKIYSKCKDETCRNNLNANTRDNLEYYIEMNSEGEIEKIYVTDGTYQYSRNGRITVNDVNDVQEIGSLDDGQIIEISDGQVSIDGTVISDIVSNRYKCIRATSFHTEECTQTSSTYYCSSSGYTSRGSKGTTTITYGNNWTHGVLKAGDPFDCDVNGDGYFDPDQERFYYVSEYFDADTKQFDNNYVVLIYYNNVINGRSSNGIRAYDSTNENFHGPRTGYVELPSVSQWRNIRLKDSTRQIYGEELNNHLVTSISGHNLPVFDYGNKAARLITGMEIARGCGVEKIGEMKIEELSQCYFLFENTKFSTSSNPAIGFWTETPRVKNGNDVLVPRSFYRNFNYYRSSNTSPDGSRYGIRPAIDVKKSDIEL